MMVRACTLALTLAAACSSPAATGPHEVRIARVYHRPVGGEVTEASHLRPTLSEALRGLEHLAPAESQRRAALGAEIWLYEQAVDGGGREVFMQAQIEAPPELRGALGAAVEASVLVERSGGGGDLAADARLAAERAFAILDARFALARGDDAAVHRLLRDPDAEVVVLALEWIRERDPRAFAGEVAALLGHADERVAALAIECLGLTGDPGYAGPIIRHAQPMRRGPMREVYRSLARLRGAEALGFLRFAAANEDDRALREEAERALRLALTGIVVERGPGIEPTRPRLARGHRQ